MKPSADELSRAMSSLDFLQYDAAAVRGAHRVGLHDPKQAQQQDDNEKYDDQADDTVGPSVHAHLSWYSIIRLWRFGGSSHQGHMPRDSPC